MPVNSFWFHKTLSPLITPIVTVTLALSAPAPDESLLEIISRLQQKYSRLESISAEFRHIYHAPGSRRRQESGRVLLHRKRRMRWEYVSPEEKLFISDGKKVYLYVPADRQVTVGEFKELDDFRTSFAFVLGRLDLRDHFIVELTQREPPIQAGDYVLRLRPKNPRRIALAEIIVEVTPSTLELRRISIVELGGARSDFVFSHVRENAPAPPERFSFIIPPNVQVLEAQ